MKTPSKSLDDLLVEETTKYKQRRDAEFALAKALAEKVVSRLRNAGFKIANLTRRGTIAQADVEFEILWDNQRYKCPCVLRCGKHSTPIEYQWYILEGTFPLSIALNTLENHYGLKARLVSRSPKDDKKLIEVIIERDKAHNIAVWLDFEAKTILN